MYEHEGLGLAAPQVALPLQLLVMNFAGDANQKDQEHVAVNPVVMFTAAATSYGYIDETASSAYLVAGIKTTEDLAGCATDDLFGWSERKDGETTRYPGMLDGFELSRDEVEALIMQARVKATGPVTRPQRSVDERP